MGKDRKTVKCLLCNETFKSDYRDARNRKYHNDLIDACKPISFFDASQQVVLNPFAAASAAAPKRKTSTSSDKEESRLEVTSSDSPKRKSYT